MTNAKPRLALALNTMYFGFPILIKLALIISAFYRMAIAVSLLLPYVLITKKIQTSTNKDFHLSLIMWYFICIRCCGMEYRHTNLKRHSSITTN
jgi:hypothetical protein